VALTTGDANNDGTVNLVDAVTVLNFFFAGGDAPPCAKAADPNNDGTINLIDAVNILDYFFAGGTMTAPDGSEINQAGHPGCVAYDADFIPDTITGTDGCSQPCIP